MMEGKTDDRMKSDMDMKNKADYFRSMNKDERDLFDQKMGERQERSNSDMKDMADKHNKQRREDDGCGDDKSDDKKNKMMKDDMDEMKM